MLFLISLFVTFEVEFMAIVFFTAAQHIVPSFMICISIISKCATDAIPIVSIHWKELMSTGQHCHQPYLFLSCRWVGNKCLWWNNGDTQILNLLWRYACRRNNCYHMYWNLYHLSETCCIGFSDWEKIISQDLEIHHYKFCNMWKPNLMNFSEEIDLYQKLYICLFALGDTQIAHLVIIDCGEIRTQLYHGILACCERIISYSCIMAAVGLMINVTSGPFY